MAQETAAAYIYTTYAESIHLLIYVYLYRVTVFLQCSKNLVERAGFSNMDRQTYNINSKYHSYICCLMVKQRLGGLMLTVDYRS